ncbi:MAG: hypothetical protein JW803_07190 [Endomicrobiales bacterium]|nr:hypothetical protein [Endomicrobiales bacterium]
MRFDFYFSLHNARKRKWLVFLPLAVVAAALFLRFCGVTSGSFEKDIGFLCDICGVSAGFYFLYFGFIAFKKKTLIENTPTSKIRSVAMGLCEVSGTAREKSPLKSKITYADCVLYKFLIEREVRSSRGRRSWVTISSGVSTHYFYIDDGTGKILVDPLDAELMMEPDYRHVDISHGVKTRYTEWYIGNGDPVYVIGCVGKFRDCVSDRKDRLIAKIKKVKSDKQKMKTFDTNEDGIISAEEWDHARERIEEEFLKEELERPQEMDVDDIVISKGAHDPVFLISDRSEKDVLGKLSLMCYGAVGGGFIIVIMMCASAIARAGFLPGIFRIPWEIFYR